MSEPQEGQQRDPRLGWQAPQDETQPADDSGQNVGDSRVLRGRVIPSSGKPFTPQQPAGGPQQSAPYQQPAPDQRAAQQPPEPPQWAPPPAASGPRHSATPPSAGRSRHSAPPPASSGGSQQSAPPPFRPPGTARPDEPDWAALAEVEERGRKRRRLLVFGGGALAAAVVAGIVATAVVATNDSGKPSPNNSASGGADSLPTEPDFPDVSQPSAPDPLDFISSAAKDTAPLNAGTLFPGKRTTMDGRAYDKATTSSTESCASAASGALGQVLTSNGCQKVLRATYVRGGVAITVGVAVFDDKSVADKVRDQASGYILSLPGGGVPTFCRGAACQLTTNSVGRYAYFTTAGFTNGKDVPSGDAGAEQASHDIGTFALNRIVQRGRDAADAAGQ